MKRLKVAIHIHTHYSYDSNMAPATLIRSARRMGLDCIAVTDHNVLDGALETQALGGIRVIVGEEISSADGHIVGLFLKKRIPPKLSGEETCAAIHEQGGLALAAHPFASLCRNSLRGNVRRLIPHLDAVECYNAQNPLPWEDWRSDRFTRASGLPAYVGMDAHLRWLPAAYQRMNDFDDPASFLESLRSATLFKSRVGFRYYSLMIFRHYWDMFVPRRLPGSACASRGVELKRRRRREQRLNRSTSHRRRGMLRCGKLQIRHVIRSGRSMYDATGRVANGQGKQSRVHRSAISRFPRFMATSDRADRRTHPRILHGRLRLRRLIAARLAGHQRIRHDHRARAGYRSDRPVLSARHAFHDLRHTGPAHPANAIRATPAR